MFTRSQAVKMPADYASAAQALSLPVSPRGSSPGPPSSPSTNGPLPPWVRSRSGSTARLATPYSRGSDTALPLGARLLRSSTNAMYQCLRLFARLTPLQRLLAAVAGFVVLALAVVSLVFSHRLFAAFAPVARGWRSLSGGWFIIWLMTFATSFPPMVGYSFCVTIAGFVYGFPGGWPISASATVCGSTAAFFTSRTIFSGYVNKLVGTDRRFVALGQVLRHDGVPVLAAIRFCPLPYSLSNGFLATIPSISPLNFALATAMASPKLLVHVFIGSRLAALAENDNMSAGDRAVNYMSMLLGGAVGMVVGLVIYRRTMARAQELALEDAENGNILNQDGELNYGDLGEGVTGGRHRDETDAAALMDEDALSLWDTEGDDGGYRDDASDSQEPDKANTGHG